MTVSDYSDAVLILRQSESFLIVGHVNPDGDCLGSMCAVGLTLANLGKSAFMVSLDGVPDLYKFLPGSERILREIPGGRRFDAAIVLDSDRPDRLGQVMDALSLCDRVLVLDHHLDGEWNVGTRIIDPTSASCGELVFALLKAAEIQITKEVADCLFTAVVTDTGSFRYSNVKPETLRTAADLVALGASPDKVAQRVYESRMLSATKLLGIALSNIETAEDGRVTYTVVTRAQIEGVGATDADTEGIVSYVRSIRGAKAAIFFREATDGTTRVSLRSSNGKDISQVARHFGGGGHRAAAGCSVDRPVGEAVKLVLEAVKAWMAS